MVMVILVMMMLVVMMKMMVMVSAVVVVRVSGRVCLEQGATSSASQRRNHL